MIEDLVLKGAIIEWFEGIILMNEYNSRTHFHSLLEALMFSSIKSALVVAAKNIPVGIGLGIGMAVAAGTLGTLGSVLSKSSTQVKAKIQARKAQDISPQSAQAA